MESRKVFFRGSIIPKIGLELSPLNWYMIGNSATGPSFGNPPVLRCE